MAKYVLIPEEVAILQEELNSLANIDTIIMNEYRKMHEIENTSVIYSNNDYNNIVDTSISQSLLYGQARKPIIEKYLRNYEEPLFYSDEVIMIGTTFTLNDIENGVIVDSYEKTLVESNCTFKDEFLPLTSSLGKKVYGKKIGDVFQVEGFDELGRKVLNTIQIASVSCKYIKQPIKTR